jgi:hypothetical protein
MNTKSLLTRIAVPVLSLGLLGGIGATLATSAGPASAATMASVAKAPPAPKTVTATTLSPNHYDTTDVTTGLNEPGGGGPLWAYDTLHETFTAVPDGGGNWGVTITVKGTFDGFASPTVANTPEHNQGNVTGKIYYYVHSANTPKAGLLPKQLPPYTGLSAALSQLFGGDANVTGGGNYAFTYTNVDGQVYTQSS